MLPARAVLLLTLAAAAPLPNRSSTPTRRSAASTRRVRRPGAPQGRGDARRPILSLYPYLSHPRGLAGVCAPPLAVASSLWPLMPRANPVAGFATTPSSSQVQPRSVSCPDGRDWLTPAIRRRAPPSTGQAPPPFAPFEPEPFRLDPTARLDLTRGQPNQYRSTLGLFAKEPLSLVQINSRSSVVEK